MIIDCIFLALKMIADFNIFKDKQIWERNYNKCQTLTVHNYKYTLEESTFFGNDFEAAKLQSIAVSFQRMIQQI